MLLSKNVNNDVSKDSPIGGHQVVADLFFFSLTKCAW